MGSNSTLIGLTIGVALFVSSLWGQAVAPIAITGEPAPGIAGATITSIVGPGGFSNSGHVGFRAILSGPGVTTANDEAMITASQAGSILILREGSAVPGFPGSSFTSWAVSVPAINATGDYSLTYNAAGGALGASSRLLLRGGINQSGLETLARTGLNIPSSTTAQFSALFSEPLSGDRSTSALAYLSGTTVNASNDVAAYHFSPQGQITSGIREGDPAVGFPIGATYGFISQEQLNVGGRTVLQVSVENYLVPGNPNTPNGTYMIDDSGVRCLARSGQQSPYNPNGVLGFARPNDLTTDGSTLFTTFDGVGSALCFAAPSGKLSVAIRHGEQVAGYRFEGPWRAFTNDSRMIGALARLSGPGINSSNGEAVITGTDDDFRIILQEGDPAPGLPGLTIGTIDINASSLAQNEIGMMTFRGILAGPGVTTSSDDVLFAADANGFVRVLAREGDLFNLGNGFTKTIASSTAHMSDTSLLALGLQFSDGTAGIFATTVPEPTGLVAGCMMLLHQWRRQRFRIE